MYMDGALAAIVTVLRTCVDAVHLFHLWLQFRLAYVSRESLVVGCGKLVWDPRAIASHYVRSLKGFWFDVFVILPVPQVSSAESLKVHGSEKIISGENRGFLKFVTFHPLRFTLVLWYDPNICYFYIIAPVQRY